MASSVSGLDEPNRALIGYQSGQGEGTTRCIPQWKVPWKPYKLACELEISIAR